MRSNQETSSKNFPIKVVQFGEGRFLRSFIETQVEEMNRQNLFNGRVAIVQPLPFGRLKELEEQENQYTVQIAGRKNGETLRKEERITCVAKGINPYEDYESFLKLASVPTLEVLTSNTTEAGILWSDEGSLDFQKEVPKSFPAKVTVFLYERFLAQLNGLLLLPCELIEENGRKLKKYVQKHAENWQFPKEFFVWLEEENVFASTLVDRIVSAPVAVSGKNEETESTHTEPFFFFAIEGRDEVAEKIKESWPIAKAGKNVVVVKDIQPYRERKVRLLNGAHTAMAMIGLLRGFTTVEEFTKSTEGQAYIQALYEEIIPLIHLPEKEVRAYAKEVMERYLNPYLHHSLQDIALNSVSKFQARLLPSFLEYREKFGEEPVALSQALTALKEYHALHKDEKTFQSDEPIERLLERL